MIQGEDIKKFAWYQWTDLLSTFTAATGAAKPQHLETIDFWNNNTEIVSNN